MTFISRSALVSVSCLLMACPGGGPGSDGGLQGPIKLMKVVSLGAFAPDSERTPIRWAPGGRILANQPLQYASSVFENGAWTALGRASPDGGVFLGTAIDDDHIAGQGEIPQWCGGICIIDRQGVRFICNDPNTDSAIPMGLARDGHWWAYASQGLSNQKVVQTWPDADPTQRQIVWYLAQSYAAYGLNALGDYLVRDTSRSWSDPGYVMLAGQRYPDELTWGVSGAGLSGVSIGIDDQGTVLGGTVDVGIGFLYRDGGVSAPTTFKSSLPVAIARNGDYVWMTGDDRDPLPKWTHGGATSSLKLNVGNWLLRKPVLLSDRGELLFSDLPNATGLASLFLVFPADQPNPLGETAISVTASGPSTWDTGPFELFSQDVSRAPTITTWAAQSVLEGHPTRSLAVAFISAAGLHVGDEFTVAGGGLFVQWGEEKHTAMVARDGSARIDAVDGRTVRATLTGVVFAEGGSDVLRVEGTLHTRGAIVP